MYVIWRLPVTELIGMFIKLDNETRDKLLIETHQDVKWIKEWIKDQNKYRYMVWAALVGAVISLLVR